MEVDKSDKRHKMNLSSGSGIVQQRSKGSQEKADEEDSMDRIAESINGAWKKYFRGVIIIATFGMALLATGAVLIRTQDNVGASSTFKSRIDHPARSAG